jgi:hypothetical protein
MRWSLDANRIQINRAFIVSDLRALYHDGRLLFRIRPGDPRLDYLVQDVFPELRPPEAVH